MNYNVFQSETDEKMKELYTERLRGREEGLRPKVFDPFIVQVQNMYQYSFGEAWSQTDTMFLEEVARRYFARHPATTS